MIHLRGMTLCWGEDKVCMDCDKQEGLILFTDEADETWLVCRQCWKRRSDAVRAKQKESK